MKVKTADRIASVQEYFFSKKLKEIAQMNASGSPVINLGIGSPDLAPAADVVTALTENALQDGNHGYQSYVGVPELRQAFASFYQTYFNVQLNPTTDILPLIGSKEGIMHISMAFVNPGDEVLIPDPGYPAYAAATKLAGGHIKTYDLKQENNWLPDFDALEQLVSERTKMIWVTYPHMPTGAKATYQTFEKLVAFAQKHAILLVNDNPYAFILNEDQMSILSVPGAMDVAMELNSLSKSHNMAGWRIGMLAGAPNYLEAVLKFKSNMDSGMFKPMQLAAIKALEQPKSWFDEINTVYAERRKIALEILSDLECTVEENRVGMFVWGKIPATFKDGFAMSDAILYNCRVFITPGGIFGKNGENYIRISLCSTAERLREAQQIIRNTLKTSTIA